MAVSPAIAASEPTAPARSALDAPLLYQILIGELELQAGRTTQAFDILLDAARRSRDESVFRRAVQVGLQTRSTERVLAAIKAWRTTVPQSLEAIQYQFQAAVSMQRAADAVEPFAALLEKSPPATRANLLASLPAVLERATDRKASLQAFEPTLLAQQGALKAPALSALGKLHLASGDHVKALALVEQAQATSANSRDAADLATELLGKVPRAELLVQRYLSLPVTAPAKPDGEMRINYGRALAQANRHGDALPVLQAGVREAPESARGWLLLASVQLELKQPKDAEASLKRLLDVLATRAEVDASAVDAKRTVETPLDPADAESSDVDRIVRQAALVSSRNQAYLMLAQAAEQRGDHETAAIWLEKVEDGERGLDVVLRRATMMGKRGQVSEARSLLRNFPEATPDDKRAKFAAEGQLLRELKRWQDSYDTLAEGVKAFPDDIELLYEQAMMAEKLDRMTDMERLLRQVIALKPDHQHAYNALGYSLADRGVRLPEARDLVKKALELAPGDPFITDSLGWIEFRIGNRAEALRLLQSAWATRPDAEIGAHLGEVLWTQGQQDDAKRVWREAANRDASNDVLQETLKRLKVDLR